MQRLQNTFEDLLAALIFFTRLPWWRLHKVEGERFRHAAEYWPFAGWITGGSMTLVFAFGIQVMEAQYAVLMALGVRLLLTGALHEDGLADFCDGMGGGHSREQRLRIMKDSHIGTFGVLGLIIYYLFIYNAMQQIGWVMILTADIWGKCCASLLITQLPYARHEEEAKARMVYAPMKWGWQALRILIAMIPVVALWLWTGTIPHPLVLTAPLITEILLMLFMHSRLQGYTGDCCGATFLLCEASMYMMSLGFRV